MRVDNVDPTKERGFIKFNTDTEMDLIAESMDRLVSKQKKLVDETGEAAETRKLERFQKSREDVIEIPAQRRMKLRIMKNKVKEKIEERNKKMMAIGNFDKVVEDIEDTPEFKNINTVIANAEEGSGLREDTEVTHRDIHVLVNALNEHIWDMEKDGFNKKTRRNQQKYEKLKLLLDNAQEQKAKFEVNRIRPKPRGYGRLRK